jgi:hypothetical protein
MLGKEGLHDTSVIDATVYLLECIGDLAGALKIMLNTLSEKVEQMLTSYLSTSL